MITGNKENIVENSKDFMAHQNLGNTLSESPPARPFFKEIDSNSPLGMSQESISMNFSRESFVSDQPSVAFVQVEMNKTLDSFLYSEIITQVDPLGISETVNNSAEAEKIILNVEDQSKVVDPIIDIQKSNIENKFVHEEEKKTDLNVEDENKVVDLLKISGISNIEDKIVYDEKEEEINLKVDDESDSINNKHNLSETTRTDDQEASPRLNDNMLEIVGDDDVVQKAINEDTSENSKNRTFAENPVSNGENEENTCCSFEMSSLHLSHSAADVTINKDQEESIYEDALCNVAASKSIINRTMDELTTQPSVFNSSIQIHEVSTSAGCADRIFEAEAENSSINSNEGVLKPKRPKRLERRPSLRSERFKTQTISNSLLLKMENDEKFKNDKEQLTEELKKLQNELNKTNEINRLKEKLIVKEALERKTRKDLLMTIFSNVHCDYKFFIMEQRTDLKKLKCDIETLGVRFTTAEAAFSIAVQKYEKVKEVIEVQSKNEDNLKLNVDKAEERLTELKEKLKKLNEEYEHRMKIAQESAEEEQAESELKIVKLKTMVKRLEIQANSVETALKQKTDECDALAALCDDITGRPSALL